MMGSKITSYGFACYFRSSDVIFVAPDYRNFPQVTFMDMMGDAEMAMKWIFDNIERFLYTIYS